MARRLSPAAAILGGGAVAGAFDISYACIFSWIYRGVSPVRVLQSVAGGLLGKESFDGGIPTAALGLGLHFFIALCWSAGFYVAATQIRALVRYGVIAGLAYGLVIYGFMNYVVLPTCALHAHAPTDAWVVSTGVFVHMVLIGSTIAWFARQSIAADPLTAPRAA